MKCPFCGHTEDRVVDSRVGREGEVPPRAHGHEVRRERRNRFDLQVSTGGGAFLAYVEGRKFASLAQIDDR